MTATDLAITQAVILKSLWWIIPSVTAVIISAIAESF